VNKNNKKTKRQNFERFSALSLSLSRSAKSS